MRVLIIEDEAAICQLVRDQLEIRGVGTVAVGSVAAARGALTREDFQAVILDLTLPDGSGLEVLADLRSSGSDAHVIVLTGAGSEADRIYALDSGADDYVVKPFFARELAARVLAVERRRSATEDTTLRIGPLEIDLNAREVTTDGHLIDLTTKEFALLAFLAARPGHTFSRAELLRAVWQSSPDWQQIATVTEHIRRLRTKIEADPRHPEMLKTVRGAGYRLEAFSPDSPTAAHHDHGDDSLGAAILIHVGGRIVAADAAAVDVLGGEREADLLGRKILELVATVSRTAASERMEAIGAGEVRRSQMLTLRRLDGTEVVTEVGSTTITWNGQQAVRVELFVSADLSARLRHLVTGVHSDLSDAVIVTDLHFHVRSWNAAAERLYGWREHEALGRHLLDVFDWEDDELSSAARNLEKMGRWHAQGRQRTRDGSLVDVMSSMTMMHDVNGDVIGVVSVNRAVPPPLDHPAGRVGLSAADIRRGLDADEFEVHYQPVVALADGSLITVEALVRWQHPEHGLLWPDAFIDTAELSGMIIELGAFVLDTASRQVADWRARGADVGLSVNVSAAELADPGLVDRVLVTIADAGLEPEAMWLEVTETSLVREVDQAAAMLHQLAGRGISIAIDDFGTGWASLTYLSKFPIHALKIDRSFVANIDESTNDRAIARSIMQLGTELGLVVVAEGIETVGQCEAVRALGCLMGQGYLFGQPTPADDVPIHLAPRIEHTDAESAHAGSMDSHLVSSARPDPAKIATLLAPARSVLGAGEAHGADTLAKPAGGELVEHEYVSGMLRGLLRVQTSDGAVELLQQTVRRLGGQLVLASECDADALPLDVSLGEGPPMMVTAEPFSVARMQLERILPRLVEDARQAVDLLREAERLTDETNHDLLTGLANRRVLDRVLPRIDDGAIVMIDLDHFKAVNDDNGHATGDAVLASFGRMLAEEVRTSDTTCRVGGEEFVIVLPGMDGPTAVELIDRMRRAWVHEAPLPITFSAGVAVVSTSGGTAALLTADKAMYLAKSNGRNRTELAAVQRGLG